MSVMPMELMSHVGWSPCKTLTLSSITSAAPMAKRFFRFRFFQFPKSSPAHKRRYTPTLT